MILSRDQIIFCRIKAKCFWPAQIKQIKRGGGYDVHFINRDDQDIQNKNESDIITFEEGLEKFKGSKQQGFEEAIAKAKNMIEEQSNLKKTSRKPQSQTLNHSTSAKSSSGASSSTNEGQKLANSNLTKRRNAQLPSSSNSIESHSSLEESSQSQEEQQPSKKLKTTAPQQSKGKALEKPVQAASLAAKANSKAATTKVEKLTESQEQKSGKRTPIQPAIPASSRVMQKKNEKIEEKDEKKLQKAESANMVADGKRTPTRSQSKQIPKNEEKQNNQTETRVNGKPSASSIKEIKGKKEIIQEVKETGKQSKTAVKQPISTVSAAVNVKTEKKETRQSGKQAFKSTEMPVVKADKKSKKSNGEEEQKEDSKKNKREVSASSDTTSAAGNKKFQKKENLKFAPTSSSTASSSGASSSSSSTTLKNAQSKKNGKGEVVKNQTQQKGGKDNLKDQIKKEDTPRKKSGAKKRGGQRKSASKKKERVESSMEEEEDHQQEEQNLEQNNLFKNMFTSNNIYDPYGQQEMHLDQMNSDNAGGVLGNLGNGLLGLGNFANSNQQIQESPEFGQKIFGENGLVNNLNLNFTDEISKGILQNITNNQLLNNLIGSSSSSNSVQANLNTNTFKGFNSNIGNTFSNNLFLQNETKENNEIIFSLNNSPFGTKDRKYFDDQDELNLAAHPEDGNKQQTLSTNQQQQILINALKQGGVTQAQFDFYSQKLSSTNTNNNYQLFDSQSQSKSICGNSSNLIGQNLKFNNIFASSNQQSTGISENSNSVGVLGNITNQIQSIQNSSSNKNGILSGLSQSFNPLMNTSKQEGSLLNNQGMSSSMANQSSILSFGVPKQEFTGIPALQNQSSMGSQMYGLNSQGDFLSQNDLLQFSQGHSLTSSQNLFASGIQTSVQPPSFSNQNSQSSTQSSTNSHSVLIPSPKFVAKQSSGSNNLQISNNSSFKLSPQSSKQHKCEVYSQMKNKILPMLEMKIKNKVYYENEKDMWLCEIVDCVRQLKAIPIEQIYSGEYSMLLEQIYDALLTIQESTKRNFQYVLSMIQRTMTDLDKKIIKYLHDYSRVRGEKYNMTREEEIQKRFSQASEHAIKIEDKDDSIEISSSPFSSSLTYGSRSNKSYQAQVKLEPHHKQNVMSPPSKPSYKDKENESTAKKVFNRSKNDHSAQNCGFFNNNNNNNNNTTNTTISTSMNQSLNNDLCNQSTSETLREINNQPEFGTKSNQILDLAQSQQIQKIVKEEAVS